MTQNLPSDRELEALKILWEKQRATVREICGQLGAPGEELAYTTVLSLLQVMEQKGLVDHEQEGKAYVYFPKVQREATFRGIAGQLLDKVFDGAVDEYLVHALAGRRVSPAELKKLEKLIAQTKKTTHRPSRKST